MLWKTNPQIDASSNDWAPELISEAQNQHANTDYDPQQMLANKYTRGRHNASRGGKKRSAAEIKPNGTRNNFIQQAKPRTDMPHYQTQT